jgi:nitrite reductase/ring-hydroxylating ferredoxin subunit
MMFRKKTIQNDSKLEMTSEHELASLEGISSIFKNNPSESEIITFALDELSAEKPIEESILVPESDLPKPSTSKAVRLIQEVQKIEDRTIKPFVDYNEGHLFYPILSKIGEVQDNIEYLDGLVTDGILEQKIYEKLIVCPIHPDTFSSSVRLYCPKCHSMNVEKLKLFEHKKCGYITESSNFDFSDHDNSNCPSCKKPIKNFEKEIRVPAMWYQCNGCSEKFDNAVIKLHCRKHEHDFDTNSGQFITTFSYKLKNSEMSINSDTSQIKDELLKLLQGFNFTAKLNVSVKGKSGNVHEIPIYGKSKTSNESILIFIKNKPAGIDQSDMNTILVPKLDINPTNTLLVTVSDINDGVDSLAKHYDIDLISEPDFSQIISRVEEFVSKWYSKNSGKEQNSTFDSLVSEWNLKNGGNK